MKLEWLVTHKFAGGDPITGESFCCGGPLETYRIKAETDKDALESAPPPKGECGFLCTTVTYVGPRFVHVKRQIFKMPEKILMAEALTAKKASELTSRLNGQLN